MTVPRSIPASAIAGIAIPVGVLYSFTAARSVVFIDSGELSAVAWTMGIAHPTGYPLYTLLSWIAAHLPGAAEPIARLNFLSVVFSAAGIGVFALLAARLLGGGAGHESRRWKSALPAAAVFAGATLGLSTTWWSQSASVEVYPLHALFLPLLVLLFLSAFPREKARGGSSAAPPAAHLFAFTLGLSFANHMSTIYLAPALVTLYVRRRGMGGESRRALLALVPAFVAGLSAYLYLPVRASADPLMNWGEPDTLSSLLRHLAGKQYSVWIFSSAETAARQLGYFFTTLAPQFSYVPVALAVPGTVFLFRRDREIFLLVLLLFAGCLAFAVNYDISDIESYFLLAYVATALAAGAGLLAVLLRTGPARGRLVIAGAAAFLLWQGARTYPEADQSGLRLVDQYSRSILAASDSGAVVFSYQWDYFVSASYYHQLVDGFRRDVAVVDKELLRRTWYFDHLRRMHPWLLEGVLRETEEYLVELRKFENGRPYDPRVIEGRYAALIGAIVARHIPGRAVYVTPEIEAQYTAGYRRVPHGLAFRLRRPGEEDGWRDVPVIVDPPARSDRYSEGLTMLAARAETGAAQYLAARGLPAESRRAAERALAIRPDFAPARAYLGGPGAPRP